MQSKEIQALKAQVVLLKKMLQDKTVIVEPVCCGLGYISCCGDPEPSFDWPQDVVDLLSSTPDYCLAEIEAWAVTRAVDYLIEKSVCSIYAHDVIESMPRKETQK